MGTSWHPVSAGFYDALFWVDYGSNKVIPRMATSFTSNSDATVWTLKLRPGVKFTDGTPFDAAAVKFNWDRYLVPVNAALCRGLIASWTSSVVVDPLTLRITLPASDATLPSAMFNPGAVTGGCATTIASPTALQKYGAQYGTSPETTVGAGAFIMTQWVRGDHVTSVRNPNFWDAPRPYLDSITWKVVPNATTGANAIISGTAQTAIQGTGAAAQAPRVKGAGGGVYFQDMAGGFTVLFNPSRGALADDRVRQALILASDVTDVNLKAYATLDAEASTYYPKGSAYYDPSLAAKTNDLKAAQKLIDAYVAEKGGPIKFTIESYAGFELGFSALAQQWNRLHNVAVSLQANDNSTVAVKILSGNFDVSVSTISPNTATSFQAWWGTGGSANVVKYSDPTLDALIAKGKAATVPADQAAINKEIAKRLLDLHWFLLVARGQAATFTAKNVKVTRMHDPTQIDYSTAWLSK
jgi:peptide/nickel transport system substrate-binding protein